MERGHADLVAIMDWHTRAVISWRLTNTWRPHDSLGGSRPWEIYRPATCKKAA